MSQTGTAIETVTSFSHQLPTSINYTQQPARSKSVSKIREPSSTSGLNATKITSNTSQLQLSIAIKLQIVPSLLNNHKNKQWPFIIEIATYFTIALDEDELEPSQHNRLSNSS
jgi:hypothetical protein